MKYRDKKRQLRQSLAVVLSVIMMVCALPANVLAVSVSDALYGAEGLKGGGEGTRQPLAGGQNDASAGTGGESGTEDQAGGGNGISTGTGEENEAISGTVSGDMPVQSGGAVYAEETVSGCNAVLKDQEPLTFAVSSPPPFTYEEGAVFHNPAVGGSGSGAVTYAVENAGEFPAARVDAGTGDITPLRAGTVTVKAIKAGDGQFREAEASYLLTIEKGIRPDFRFEQEQPADFIYQAAGDNTYTNAIALTGITGITYTISEMTAAGGTAGEIAVINQTDGSLAISGTGKITVTARLQEDDCYRAASASYTMNIREETGELAFLTTGPVELTYEDNLIYTNTVSGGDISGVTYTCTASGSPDATDAADVDPASGRVSVHKAGRVTITATDSLTMPQRTASYELIIKKAEQQVSFSDAAPADIVYGTEYQNAASALGSAVIAYSSDQPEVAEADASGRLTVKKAGKVTITARSSETGAYEAGEASYTITVGKAPQSIRFPQNAYSLTYGMNFAAGEAPEAVEEGSCGSGRITYSVTGGQDIASVNTDSGELTFAEGRVGRVTVSAVKPADERYREARASYELTVACLTLPEGREVYTPESGSVSCNGWYTGNVSIKAADGYSLSLSNALTGNLWESRLTDVVTEDGEARTVSFYVKDDGSGGISDRITLTINKDGGAPSAGIKIKEQTLFERLLSFFSFGEQDTVKARVLAEDTVSGVDRTEYFISEGLTVLSREQLEGAEWQSYDPGAGLSFADNRKLTLYARVTDRAGNVSFASTNGIVLDKADPLLEAAPLNLEAGACAAGDVRVKVEARDIYSGLKSVEYRITCDGNVTQETRELYRFDKENPGEADLVTEKREYEITVPAAENNSDNVLVIVRAEDNAGNMAEQSIPLRIDVTSPRISVSMNGTQAYRIVDGHGYFNGGRTAEIKITERTSNFDGEAALAGIRITGQDAEQNTVALPLEDMIGGWVTEEPAAGVSPDQAVHTARVTFAQDARYRWSIAYTDKAGNASLPVTSQGDAPYDFTVDTACPEGLVYIEQSFWGELLERLTFGLWKNTAVSVTASGRDVTSPFTMEYYVSDRTEAMTDAELDLLEADRWTAYRPFDVDKEKCFAVYVRLKDYAGNYKYISTDGFIVDRTAPAVELKPDEANVNGIYSDRDGVGIDLSVKELPDEAAVVSSGTSAGISSGIRSVEYWVVCDGRETQRETLYKFDTPSPSYDDLQKSWTGRINVDTAANNSDNVTVHVRSVDNAGNERTESLELEIDVTSPVISVEFTEKAVTVAEDGGAKAGGTENGGTENGGTDGGKGERGYFGQSRSAKITVTERTSHFDGAAAAGGIRISAETAKGEPVSLDLTEMFSGWTTEEGAAPDEAVHTAFLTFAEDGNYTWSIAYTDKAGNTGRVETAGDTPFTFTVDRGKPSDCSVSVDESVWDRILEKLTFGIWKNHKAGVSVTADDLISPFDVEYFTTANTAGKTQAELEAYTDWLPFRPFTVEEDRQFTVYARIRDYAGNTVYVGTNGVIVDQTESIITLTPEEPNENGIYNGDVRISVNVRDQYPYSGIQSVEYWIVCDGKETKRETLFRFDRDDPAYEELVSSLDRAVTVRAEENNSCNVTFYVRTTDNAGNTALQSLPLDIDVTAPRISVSYDNNQVHRTEGGRGYFSDLRTAVVTITERTHHFDAAAATEGIAITALDAEGNSAADVSGMISGWRTEEGQTPDETIHTALIYYDTDANYTFAVSYTDRAGNAAPAADTGDSVSPFAFTVDRIRPTGSVRAEGLGVWDRLLETVTFGLWSREAVTVTGEASDTVSPLEPLAYYKTADTSAKTPAQLDAVTEWKPFDALTVNADERFVIYLKAVDFAGNVTYIGTDGVIVDDDSPLEETLAPRIHISAGARSNDISSGDVEVDIRVTDPENSGAYSGLRRISYQVLNMGEETQGGNLFTFEKASPKQAELQQSWLGGITVNSSKNNSNDVAIIVTAEDNAGNVSSRRENVKIDVTRPSISVTYDNNAGDTSFGDKTYFKADRTATIRITERNFSPEMVKLEIANTDGPLPSLSGWSEQKGDGNGDGTTYTAALHYSEDGDYTFAAAFTDNAGNTADGTAYGDSLAPASFTLDKTLPVIEVSYDNNAAENENYFSTGRTATVTVREHNFEPGRVEAVITATDNNAALTAPKLSSWTGSGDTHTALISFQEDALYSFDIDYADMAGNSAADFEAQSFYVDTTPPEVEITDISDRSAYNGGFDGGESIGFTVRATDTNFDLFDVDIEAVVRENGRCVTRKLDEGAYSAIAGGRVLKVDNLSADGIYSVRCSATDKAGNAYREVTLYDNGGRPYLEERGAQDTLVTFSVNRGGSTFATDEATSWLVGDGGIHYVRGVDGEVTVNEINADALDSCRVTLNDRLLTEGRDYRRTLEERRDNEWYCYTYTLDRSLFEDGEGNPLDGEYNVVISSVDKAENEAFSDVKDCRVHFVVDTREPEITVMSGLAAGGRYQTQAQEAVIRPVDDGGRLDSLTVQILDRDGKVTATPLRLEGDAFAEALSQNHGDIPFTIGEGLYQQVRILCSDASEDRQGNHNLADITYDNITVSTSSFMIFWANKPLRWTVIGGTAATGGAAAAGVVLVRRKSLWKRKKKQA